MARRREADSESGPRSAPTVFIRHASSDRVIAHGVADRLRQRGYASFIDFAAIPGGTVWEKEIYAVLRSSRVLLLCATPEAVESRWVFSPDGMRLITASPDHTARIWPILDRDALLRLARSRVFRRLTPRERREYGLPRDEGNAG